MRIGNKIIPLENLQNFAFFQIKKPPQFAVCGVKK